MKQNHPWDIPASTAVYSRRYDAGRQASAGWDRSGARRPIAMVFKIYMEIIGKKWQIGR
jgi:hypothetical protein